MLDPSMIRISQANGNQVYPSVTFGSNNYMAVWEDGRGSAADIYGSRVTPLGTVLDTAGRPISVAPNRQRKPSIHFTGGSYFVAWEDNRSASGTLPYGIYGARVDSSGTVLDSTGIAIDTTTRSVQVNATVGFDGTNSLVVWNADDVQGDIYGARVNQSGSIIDTGSIPISTIVAGQYEPAVAHDDSTYLITWCDARGYPWSDIYGMRVSCDGQILDSASIAVSTSVDSQVSPSVVFDGSDYLAVWHDYHARRKFSHIFGARVSPRGTILDTGRMDFLRIAPDFSNHRFASAVFNSTASLVVWETVHNANDADIFGVRIRSPFEVLDSNSIAIATAAGTQKSPVVASGGENYLVVWQDNWSGGWDIYATRVDQNGVVIDIPGISVTTAPANQDFPAAAFDGTNYLIVWQDDRTSWWGVWCARLTQSGVVLDSNGIHIATTGSGQCRPAVAFDGANYLVVWQDLRGSGYDICGAHVSTSGSIVDRLEISNRSGDQVSPTVTCGPGNHCLVMWSGWTDSINHRPANTMRIWGKFLSQVGIEENQISSTIYQRVNLQMYPNPFRRQVRIELTIGRVAKGVELKIYDVSGRMVKSFPLASRTSLLATSSIIWGGADDRGKQLPAGVYFCRLESGAVNVTKKLVKLE